MPRRKVVVRAATNDARTGGAEAVVVEVVLGDPDGLVAERLGGQHLLEAGIVDGLLAPPLVPLHEEEQPEFHRD
jgi:hypothetical protein